MKRTFDIRGIFMASLTHVNTVIRYENGSIAIVEHKKIPNSELVKFD